MYVVSNFLNDWLWPFQLLTDSPPMATEIDPFRSWSDEKSTFPKNYYDVLARKYKYLDIYVVLYTRKYPHNELLESLREGIPRNLDCYSETKTIPLHNAPSWVGKNSGNSFNWGTPVDRGPAILNRTTAAVQ